MDIRVLDILNSDHELQALPVEENLELLLSVEPDLFDIQKRIFLIRVESDQEAPNLSDAFIRSVGDTYVDNYDVLDYDFTVAPVDLGYKFTINPVEPLLPNSNYYVVVSKELAPKYYTVSKDISLGTSLVSVETGTGELSEDATYRLVVSTTSSLADGQHIVGFDLYKDNVQVLFNQLIDIKNGNLDIGPTTGTVFLGFSQNIPFLAGEEWTISTLQFSRLNETKAQSFSTIIDSAVIESPEETSSRIANADILKFYEENGWAGRTSSTPSPTVAATSLNVEYTFVYPNKIYMKFDTDIDPTSVSSATFDVGISYAFGNYLLPNMGLYNEDAKYILKYSVINGDTILIDINKDVDNIVPLQDTFLITEA